MYEYGVYDEYWDRKIWFMSSKKILFAIFEVRKRKCEENEENKVNVSFL